MAEGYKQLNEEELKKLIIQSIQGDSAVYEQLLNQLNLFLINWFGSKNVKVPQLDDLIQETLIAVHKSRHTFDENRSFISWFLAIAHYKYTDFLRYQYKYKKNVELTEELTVSKDIQDYIQNDQMTMEDLQPYVDSLGEIPKKILIQAKINGLSVKQISKLEDLSESAVKVSIHRSIHKIKEMIRGQHDIKK